MPLGACDHTQQSRNGYAYPESHYRLDPLLPVPDEKVATQMDVTDAYSDTYVKANVCYAVVDSLNPYTK